MIDKKAATRLARSKVFKIYSTVYKIDSARFAETAHNGEMLSLGITGKRGGGAILCILIGKTSRPKLITGSRSKRIELDAITWKDELSDEEKMKLLWKSKSVTIGSKDYEITKRGTRFSKRIGRTFFFNFESEGVECFLTFFANHREVSFNKMEIGGKRNIPIDAFSFEHEENIVTFDAPKAKKYDIVGLWDDEIETGLKEAGFQSFL